MSDIGEMEYKLWVQEINNYILFLEKELENADLSEESRKRIVKSLNEYKEMIK